MLKLSDFETSQTGRFTLDEKRGVDGRTADYLFRKIMARHSNINAPPKQAPKRTPNNDLNQQVDSQGVGSRPIVPASVGTGRNKAVHERTAGSNFTIIKKTFRLSSAFGSVERK